MSQPEKKPAIVPTRRQDDPFQERRQSPRYLLHGMRGRMTWQGEGGEVTCEVSVLNISGGGAAVLAETAPDKGQTLRLRLHGESTVMEPVQAQALATSLDASGQTFIRLRFTQWVVLDPILEKYRERRFWQRYPARESRATVTWLDGSIERTVRGELLNISGGGAAFGSEDQLPADVPIWLQLEAKVRQVYRVSPVESNLVATSVDPSGRKIAHLQFVEACPMELFNLAVNGGG